MRSLPHLASALALAAIVASAAPGAARAAISPQRVVSGSELDLSDFSVAMNPAGARSAVVLTGARGSRSQVLTRLGRGRSFGPSQRLDDARTRPGNGAFVRVDSPKVSVAPDGGAVAAWLTTTVPRSNAQPTYRVRVAIAPDGARFGRAHTLVSAATGRVELTGLIAGRRGLAVVSWRRGGRTLAAVRRGSKGFGRHQAIAGGTDNGSPVTLALSPGGSVVAGWSSVQESTAQAAILRVGGRRFGLPRVVSAPGESARLGRAVAGPGGAGVAWSLATRFGDPANGTLRFARLRSSDGFAAPVTLAGVGADGAPHVALPKLGVLTAWRHYTTVTEPGDNDSFSASRISASASWFGGAAPQRLTEPPALAHRPAVAALADGALIAWRHAPGGDAGSPVYLAVAGAEGWRPTQTIAPDRALRGSGLKVTRIYDDEGDGTINPALAAGGRSALVAWITRVPRTSESSRGQLRVATYTP